jgi:hypothetical protein
MFSKRRWAGFQVILIGRFWVIAEDRGQSIGAPDAATYRVRHRAGYYTVKSDF